MARYGEAEPRLTSGGKAVSQKESCQGKPKFTGL
jgi:hypothetical protein